MLSTNFLKRLAPALIATILSLPFVTFASLATNHAAHLDLSYDAWLKEQLIMKKVKSDSEAKAKWLDAIANPSNKLAMAEGQVLLAKRSRSRSRSPRNFVGPVLVQQAVNNEGVNNDNNDDNNDA